MKNLIIILLLTLISFGTFAQETNNPGTDEDRLKYIYSNLEYNTTAFNDLKDQWTINDPLLIRDAFSRFLTNKSLRFKGEAISQEEIEKKAVYIYDGQVVIKVRQRYYDNEIEYFGFFNIDELSNPVPQPLFDPVLDGYLLRDIIGTPLYLKIQDKTYFLRDLSKDEFDTKAGYAFDVNFNLLEPELMFWSTTSSLRNKYLLSLFGKWGNDKIFIPGWYFADYIAGLRIKYYNSLSDDLRDLTYSISIGVGLTSHKPDTANSPSIPLYKSGESVYFGFVADPFQFIFNDVKKLYLEGEAFLTLTNYKRQDYNINTSQEFYAIRNYFSLMIRKRDLADFADFGKLDLALGVSTHDTYNYEIVPDQSQIKNLNPKKKFLDRFEHYGLFELGVSKTGGLVQHDVRILMGYNVVREVLYVGFGFKFTLSDTFGLDVRYINDMNFVESRAPYRTDSYLVFSPIIRINY